MLFEEFFQRGGAGGLREERQGIEELLLRVVEIAELVDEQVVKGVEGHGGAKGLS